jgi:hypothetical protein
MGVVINPFWSAAGAAVVVQDAFTDSNGTLLTNHTPDIDTEGGGWSVGSQFSGSPPTITSNRVDCNGDVNVIIDSGQSDLVITQVSGSAGTRNFGTVFRWQDADNHWTTFYRSNNNDGALYEDDATVVTQRDFVSVTIDESTDYNLQVTINGTSMSCLLDGANELSYTSALFQTKTVIGMRLSGADSNADDFQAAAV